MHRSVQSAGVLALAEGPTSAHLLVSGVCISRFCILQHQVGSSPGTGSVLCSLQRILIRLLSPLEGSMRLQLGSQGLPLPRTPCMQQTGLRAQNQGPCSA